jgi:polysaccharide biosynthesis protein PslA
VNAAFVTPIIWHFSLGFCLAWICWRFSFDFLEPFVVDMLNTVTANAPRKRLSAATVLLLQASILAAEAMLVLLAGLAVSTAMAHWATPARLPSAAGMSLAYMLLITGGEAYAKLPDGKQLVKTLKLLTCLFAIGLLLSAHTPRTLPWLCLWFAAAVAAISLTRWQVMAWAQKLPSRLWPARPAAFIGNSAAAAQLLQQIEADPLRRLDPVGFFDDRSERPGPLSGKLAHLGNIEELIDYIHDHELHDVYMALPWSASDRIVAVVERLRFLPLTVHLIPDQSVSALPQHGVDEFAGVVMPILMVPPVSAFGAAFKRVLDLVASSLLVVFFAPLFAVVAAAIMLDSKGPVFFMQRRIGQFGKSFNIYKFRTLHVALSDAGAETLVGRGDTRVTGVGRWLRKFSVDELPQILNVLLGNMSLVGPRPHAPRAKADQRIYAEVMPDYMLRYRVKPGMTGWAQINGWRGNTDTEEKLRKRVQYDFDYIANWSLLKDLKILALTVPSTLFPPPDNH